MDPSTTAPDIVLGIIENYSFAQVEPFLCSLQQTGFAGKTILFYHRIPAADLRIMRTMKVTLVPFRNIRGSFPPGLRRRLFDALGAVYHRAKWPLYARGYRLLLSATKLRYILYHRFLTRYGKRYRRVLLTDTRDVFFQGDPFSPGPCEDLVFFEESHRVDHGQYTAEWVQWQLGEDALDRLSARTALCSGTLMGTPDALCFYLERYLELMQRAMRQYLPCGDQALHNAIAYEGLAEIPYSVRYSANGCGEVYTLTQYLRTDEIRRGPLGEVVNPAGGPVPIVHQYDRHPEIQEALFRRLPRRAGADGALRAKNAHAPTALCLPAK